MAMNRDNPFVNVYVGGENTLVHIRQLVHANEMQHCVIRAMEF